MEPIIAMGGAVVTEEMIDRWADALDRNEWPEGWENRGPVVVGRPPLSSEGTDVLSVKVPASLKRRIQAEAEAAGVSTSEYVRAILAARKIA